MAAKNTIPLRFITPSPKDVRELERHRADYRNFVHGLKLVVAAAALSLLGLAYFLI